MNGTAVSIARRPRTDHVAPGELSMESINVEVAHRGAVDLHCHSGPNSLARLFDMPGRAETGR